MKQTNYAYWMGSPPKFQGQVQQSVQTQFQSQMLQVYGITKQMNTL